MKHVFCLLLLATVIACQKHPSLTAKEQEAVKSEVTETLQAYNAAIRSRGLKAEFEYLDSTENFFWTPPGASMALGFDSVRTLINRNAALFETVDNVWDTITVKPLNSFAAVYACRLRSAVTDKAGATTIAHLVETGVMIRKDGRWKLLSGQTTLLSQE